jgi:Domain of unknown function (DUF4270)
LQSNLTALLDFKAIIVHKKLLFAALLMAAVTGAMVGCNKLDTTDIGSNLIPVVDNVKTFDTLLTVEAKAAFIPDSTKVSNQDNLVLGYISLAKDPIFGKTTANLFVQFKPNFYPYYLGNPRDTIQGYPGTGIDSVVVCLSYKGVYGDTVTPQSFSVREILPGTDFKGSFNYDFYYRPALVPPNVGTTLGPILSSVIKAPREMKNYTKLANGKDSINNQLRISITDPTFLAKFASFDSVTTGTNNAFRIDTIFNQLFKGFAISADSSSSAYGNNLWYTNLSEAASRLEVHYKKRPATYNAGKIDTGYSILPFVVSANAAINSSAYACNLTRTYSGAEIATPAANAIYIQTGLGTYDTLRIPELSNLPNSIIHRAELIMEQVPGLATIDINMLPPNYLYLDVADTPAKYYFKPFPIDLNPEGAYNIFPGVNNINFNYFGGFLRLKPNPAGGEPIGYYNFNITRYVQGIVTRKEPNKTLRLFAPFELDYTKNLGFFAKYRYTNSLAYGRVKLYNGNLPNGNTRMRLRIIYSKI